MIAREHRLTVKRHFKKIYDKGAKYNGDVFVCRYLRKPTSLPSKISVVMSKKTVPSAVARNLIRRRYKAFLRDLIKDMNGFDLIFIPKRGKEQSFKNISQEVEKCLKNLR